VQAFAVALAAGLVMGSLRGGRIVRLGEVRVRGFWLAAPALGIGAYCTLALGPDVPAWILPSHLAAQMMALAVVCINWALPGMRAVGLGLLLNALVMGLNGGLMPEAAETLGLNHPGVVLQNGQHIPRSKNVLLARENTRLWWLSDVVATPPGFPVRMVGSVGDIIMMLGLVVTVQGLMVSGSGRQRGSPVRATDSAQALGASTMHLAPPPIRVNTL
jgi:hypothetical protein